ncbi:MAG: tetratricopeptide repeat protein [Polyangiaceae bacterium]
MVTRPPSPLFRGLRIIGALVASTTAFVHESASAHAQECVAHEVRDEVSRCPEGEPSGGRLANKRAPIKLTPPPPPQPKTSAVPSKPTADGFDTTVIRDSRRENQKLRSKQLLVTEIQNLESLFADTKMTAADKPELARRLAEAYVELESVATTEQLVKTELADEAAKKDDGDTAKTHREAAAKAKQVSESARKSAIKHYTFLKEKFPKWCLFQNDKDPSKSTGCGDEVLYYLAFEYERAGDLEGARRVYFELIDNWKTSKYRPQAYLAFGEFFFQEATGDPTQWPLAQQAYEHVLEVPGATNKAYAYALYKLGYTYWNQADSERAVDSFKKVIEFGAQNPSYPGAAQLVKSARQDIVTVYASWGDAKKAYSFFKPLAGDSAGSDEQTYLMLDSLGRAYLDTGHYQQGLTLYRDLMGRDKGPRYCGYHARIVEATTGERSSDKKAIKKVIDEQFDVLRELTKLGQNDASVRACANTTAEISVETAMSWHVEVVGSGGIKGTADPETMRLTATLYQTITDTFAAKDFDTFTFPRLTKEDWPTHLRIRYLMADLLYFQKDWERCGLAFEEVVAAEPKGPLSREAALAAAFCMQNDYLSHHDDAEARAGLGGAATTTGNDERFKPRELSPKEATMVRSFARFACVASEATEPEEVDQLVDVQFARARTYFEARHWDEAAVAFRQIAFEHPKHEAAVYAAQLYLEALNVLATHVARPSCLTDIGEEAKRFVDLFCTDGSRAANADSCDAFERIGRDVERKHAEQLVLEADRGGPDALDKYRAAAGIYMSLWDRYGKEPCERGDAVGCARNDEILHNAALAFQAARLIAKAIVVRKILINPRYHLNETERGRLAVFTIGANYQAIAVYDEAAAYYERYATESPTAEAAPRALSDAVVLRLGLGQLDEAVKDASLFQKQYKGRAAQAAQIAFAIGAYHVERENFASGRKVLSAAMADIDKDAPLDVRVQAHALFARALEGLGEHSKAREEYDRVRVAWSNPQASVDRIMKELDSEPESSRLRRLGKAVEAVGEALFFFAEEKKDSVDKIVFPVYKGSGEHDDVQAFVNSKLADWQKKKRAAIEAADREYQKVLAIMPEPPPRWVIAAAARVGQMKGKFVAEFRAAPIPKDWLQNGPSPYGNLLWEEIRGAYYGAIDLASEPDKQAAKAAYVECLERSVKFQYFDAYSRGCEAWLSKNYPSEYHQLDEFRVGADRPSTGISERAVPVEMNGTAVVRPADETASAR